MIRRYFFCCLILCPILTGCAGSGDYEITLSGDYAVERTSALNVGIVSKETNHFDIPAVVTELNWNDDFIIAKQNDLMEDRNGNDVVDPQKYYLWIIDVKQHDIYGPLNQNEYNKNRKELHVPAKLVLKKTDTFMDQADYGWGE